MRWRFAQTRLLGVLKLDDVKTRNRTKQGQDDPNAAGRGQAKIRNRMVKMNAAMSDVVDTAPRTNTERRAMSEEMQ